MVIAGIEDWHGWAWHGWDALVAIGTLALASVTVGLVWVTYPLARQGDAEIRAQWRPVVIVREDSQGMVAAIGGNDDRLDVVAENVGRGPALDVTAELDGFEKPGPGFGAPAGSSHSAGRPLPTLLAPGDRVRFRWSGLEGRHVEAVTGLFSYEDLSRTSYTTLFFIRSPISDGAQVSQQQDVSPPFVPDGGTACRVRCRVALFGGACVALESSASPLSRRLVAPT